MIMNNFRSVDNDICRQSLINKGVLLLSSLDHKDAAISFDHVKEPVVSIIIVVRNAIELLSVTLCSLAAQSRFNSTPYEVILVDNASDDLTKNLLRKTRNTKIIWSQTNIGFGPGCNIGAIEAEGSYLLFLNPDIELYPGAIDAMVAAFASSNRVGIVGGRLVFPGGKLQEAGTALLNNERLTHGYGRGESYPFVPEALFRRKPPYVSGALLMIARELFEQVGGFDDAFAPAYFEDTDLCLRVWRNGYEVVYEPLALALHFESATSTRPSDVEKLLDRGREIFRNRHAAWIFSGLGNTTNLLNARNFDNPRLKVLYIDDSVPHLHQGAGFPRSNLIIRCMIDLGYFVSVFPLHRGESSFWGRYTDLPREVEVLGGSYGCHLHEVIQQRGDYYDVLWVSRPHNIATVLDLFEANSVNIRDFIKGAIVFDAEAIYALRDQVQVMASGGLASSAALERAVNAECRGYELADSVLCVSEPETSLLNELGLPNTLTLGHVATVRYDAPGFQDREGVVFLGSLFDKNSPNFDSISWFLDCGLAPLCEAMNQSVSLHIVGGVSDDIRHYLEKRGVKVLGAASDLFPILSKFRVMIAPTRYAAGIPLKVIESTSLGLPSVITPLLADQIGWANGAGYLVGEWLDPIDYVNQIKELYTNELIWTSVQSAGFEVLSMSQKKSFTRSIRDICESDPTVYL